MIPEARQKQLWDIVKKYEEEDRYFRERQIRRWKKAEYFWQGFHFLFWSELAQDWRTPDDITENDNIDPSLYNRVVNIYRAHGEAVIAALSSTIPPVVFFPDDINNPDDVRAAKAYSKISELIDRHNNLSLQFVHALYILWNQGLCAAYNYNEAHPKYGVVTLPDWQMEAETVTNTTCASCGYPLEESEQVCPNCGSVEKETSEMTVEVPRLVGYNGTPKSREKVEFFGPLNVKVPRWIRKLEYSPYLILEFEQHYSMLRDLFPDIRDKVRPGSNSYDYYERWGRTLSDFNLDITNSLTTVKCVWLRPWAFETLDNDDAAWFKKEFPKGCYAIFCGDTLAQVVEESMDDHWSLTESPLSSYIHADPIGAPLIPIQEIKNDLTNLEVQSVEYGIPETFADPTVLDFDKYNNSESRPGMVYPALPVSGKSLDDSFYTSKVATLSKEVESLNAQQDRDAQFVVGSFPSIYGGQMGGSRTAAEYSMSRANALQRLGTIWKMLCYWWADMKSKACREFVENMVDDEKLARKEGSSFIEIYVRQSDVESGKVGNIEPEAAEQFPTSWAQRRDVLLNIMKLGNEGLNAAIMHPKNRITLGQAIGMPEFYVPGEDDRAKQLLEIQLLLQAQPIEEPVLPGQMPMPPKPSVETEPDCDDEPVHIEICKAWLVSEEGLYNKQNNPAGYMNVKAHLNMHMMSMQSKMMPPPQNPENPQQKEKTMPAENPAQPVGQGV